MVLRIGQACHCTVGTATLQAQKLFNHKKMGIRPSFYNEVTALLVAKRAANG
jgi:hypothetical protein